MKNIITGGAGFIGSHLAEMLLHSGEDVVVIDNLSAGSLSNLKECLTWPTFKFIEGDVREAKTWTDIIERHDTIFHLAATVGVNHVMIDPIETLDNNFLPTQLILDLAVKWQCKVFFASTSEVYGSLMKAHSSEMDPLLVPGTTCGRSGYVLGKILSEYKCINYYHRFNLSVVVGRFFNVAGTHQADTYGMVIPTFVNRALSGDPLIVFGDGQQTRSFCHVDDICRGVIELMKNESAYGEILNMGSDETITIRHLAELVVKTCNSQSQIVYKPLPFQRAEGRDVTHRKPSLAKVYSVAGWRPKISFESALREIIAARKGDYAILEKAAS